MLLVVHDLGMDPAQLLTVEEALCHVEAEIFVVVPLVGGDDSANGLGIAAVDRGEGGHLIGDDPGPGEIAVQSRDVDLGNGFTDQGKVPGSLGAKSHDQLLVSLPPKVAGARLVQVIRVKAMVVGGGDDVQIDAVGTVIRVELLHHLTDLVLPKGGGRTHAGEFDPLSVGLGAGVGFVKHAAVGILGGVGKCLVLKTVILSAAVVHVPGISRHVGDDTDVGVLQFPNALLEIVMGGKVMGVVVVKGNPVPVVDMVGGGNADLFTEADGGFVPILGGMIGVLLPQGDGDGVGVGVLVGKKMHDPNGVVAKPVGGVGSAPLGVEPLGALLNEIAVEKRRVVPVARVDLPDDLSGQGLGVAGSSRVLGGEGGSHQGQIRCGGACHVQGLTAAAGVVNAHVKAAQFFRVLIINGAKSHGRAESQRILGAIRHGSLVKILGDKSALHVGKGGTATKDLALGCRKL